MRVVSAGTLALLLALAPFAPAAGLDAGVRGIVSVSGRPVEGLSVSLVNVSSGRIRTVRSNADGEFQVAVEPGEYIITGGGPGVAVGSGPAMVAVRPGAVTTARLDFADPAAPYVRTQEPPGVPPGGDGGMNVEHDPITCFVAGEGNSPIIDAVFAPPGQIVNAEVFFSSGQAPDQFYSVTMTCDATGACQGILPWPTVEADPMTYYVIVNGGPPDGAETIQFPVDIIEEGDTCKGRVAPIALFGSGPLAGLGGGGFGALAIAGTTAGVGVVTGTAIALTNDDPPPPPPPPPPTTQPPPPPPPTTQPPPTPTPTPPPPPPTPTPTPPPPPPTVPTSPIRG